MDIGTIQKKKFLNNIYRLMYADGSKPSDADVREVFTRYFASNRPGIPVRSDYNKLQVLDITDVDVLNELMVTNLFNLEILYDSVLENNNQLFSVVTSLNNKMDALRARRQVLEAKVDQMLFANSNSDGYYYSFYETFADLSNIDLNLTSAYVDIVNSSVTLPRITNIVSDSIVNKQLFTSGATMTARLNESVMADAVRVDNFDSITDGLNDTYWDHEIKSNSLGIASLKINIPVDSAFTLSKIDGRLLTSAPSMVIINAIPVETGKEEVVLSRDSAEDYSKFSFALPADSYSNISITLVKMQPDRIESSTTGMYVYHFGIRDLSISSSYYDTKASLVSSPLEIPNGDNSNLAISAVAIDVQAQRMPGTSMQYFVAPNTSGDSISAFNWMRIEPTSDDDVQNVVSLVSSNAQTKSIDTVNSDLFLISQDSTSQNINERNPTILPLSDKLIYRICSIDPNEKIIEPYILASLGTYKHYSILLSSSKIDTQQYKTLDEWKVLIANSNQVNTDYIINQVTSITPGIFTANVGLLESKLMAPSDSVATHTLTKSAPDFNLGVYLNGVLIGDLPSGVTSKSITWNFVKGMNSIIVTYDKNISGLISFNLMSGRSIDEYGIVFQDYLTYLDPIEFRNNRIENGKVFTIDNLYGSKEILSTENITSRSLLRYYSNKSDLVTAVRYRVDFSRFDNPLQSPILNSIRIKFKHNDISLA